MGAGPVGMVLGCLLGQRGIRVLMLERQDKRPEHSQAIGITPPSLRILEELDLAHAFVRHGVTISDCHVHGQTGYLGCASFRGIDSPYRFVLSLPQRESMRLLEEKLVGFPTVHLKRSAEVTAVSSHESHVAVQWRDSGNSVITSTASYAVACDGCHSQTRKLLSIPTRRHQYGCHFVMGDFNNSSFLLGTEARLYFTSLGAVESFPLPEGKRRWIVQTERHQQDAPVGLISHCVRERTGILLCNEDQLNQSSFSPWRLDCEKYHEGRVILCGDAAHVMSPIGGQGMNTGIADAQFAAALLHAVIQKGQNYEEWIAEYERCRRMAATTAATRAAMGMSLGTWRGIPLSLLRDGLMRFGLFSAPLSTHVGNWFSMMSIPFNHISQSSSAMKWLSSEYTS